MQESKSEQLSRVARDWSLVIRASQVLPVYPLTEDLQPGDVFLTTTPIGDEIKLFESKGFLPFEYHVMRLNLSGIDQFYSNWSRQGNSKVTDDRWVPFDDQWPGMPRAGFPTYSFDISRGSGVNIALPVQGVPVALSMLGADNAVGSIMLRDASTYGIDLVRLDKAIDSWVEHDQDVQRRLRDWGMAAATENGPNAYLRVISRVYMVKSVSINLKDASVRSASASAGVSRPVDLLGLASTNESAASNYDAAFKKLNAQIEGSALPGGSLKLVSASGRSVSMEEEFPRPLVIGYLAYDRRILPNGELDAAQPMLLRIDPTFTDPGVLGAGTILSEQLRVYLRSLDENRDELRSWLDRRGFDQLFIADFVRDPRYLDLQRQFVRDAGITGEDHNGGINDG